MHNKTQLDVACLSEDVNELLRTLFGKLIFP